MLYRTDQDDVFSWYASFYRTSEWKLDRHRKRLRAESGLMFVVHEVRLKFVKPARLDDLLHVSVEVSQRRAVSLQFAQRIMRAADGVVLVEAEVGAACVDAATLRPSRIPDHLFEEHRIA